MLAITSTTKNSQGFMRQKPSKIMRKKKKSYTETIQERIEYREAPASGIQAFYFKRVKLRKDKRRTGGGKKNWQSVPFSIFLPDAIYSGSYGNKKQYTTLMIPSEE